MPNSPHVDFGVTNGNVEVATPQEGVSLMIGRTTKGKPFDPSVVITNPTQFSNVFGKEIVPDGSISNMETALKLGSKIRVARVINTEDAYLGEYVVASTVAVGGAIVPDTGVLSTSVLVIKISATKYIFLGMNSKGYGEPIKGITNPEFIVKVALDTVNNLNVLTAKVFNTLDSDGLDGTPLSVINVAKYTDSSFDTQVLRSFVENNNFSNIVLVGAKVGQTLDTDDLEGINNLSDVYRLVEDEWSPNSAIYSPKASVRAPMVSGTSYLIQGDLGDAGGLPSIDDWKQAYDSTKDFSDFYQLGVSNLEQNLDGDDSLDLHTYISDSANALKEFVYYVDVPLYNDAGDPKDDEDIKDWVTSLIGNIGYSSYVAYFAGGYQYPDSKGIITDAPNMGTVMALGDVSATTKGPWYHFSGTNRGIVINSRGIVSPNYGSPSNYDKLNGLANAMVNMATVKEVSNNRKRVVLMHNFTSSLGTDSFRYLGVVRLTLYMKKKFRPILESALEEPNLPVTWRGTHRAIMKVVNFIKDNNGLTDPVYTGDQDANSFSELVYNTEANVRAGKYKAKLTFKDVIALQEITFELEIDTNNNTVTIN